MAFSADFAQYLRSQGYRLTPQRHLILEAVHRAGWHVTPEQVYEAVHKQNLAISRATIYRTLEFLCEVHLIHALYWDGQMYYEISGEEPHHHLICRTCGAIEPCDHALLENLAAAVSRKYRFDIDLDHMALFGLCRQCRAANKRLAARPGK